MTAAGVTTLTGRGAEPIDVGAVERELAAMWRSAAKPGQKPFMRACRTNLVAIGEPEVPELIEDVLAQHPARLILVTPAEGKNGDMAVPPLAAHVSATCHWRPEDKGLICSERITIRVGPGAEARVPSAVRSLARDNLPLVVMGAVEDVARYAEVGLLATADRVIIDSTGADPGVWRAISSHRPSNTKTSSIVDLGWIRLRSFRAAVAQAVLRSALRRSLSRVDAVDIAHAGAPTAALLLAGWIAERLRWGRLRRLAAAEGRDRSVVVFELGGRGRRAARLRIGPASAGEALVVLLRSAEEELRVALPVAEAAVVITSAPGRDRLAQPPSRGRKGRSGNRARSRRPFSFSSLVRRQRVPIDVIPPADAIVAALGHGGLCDPTAPVALARALEMAAALASRYNEGPRPG